MALNNTPIVFAFETPSSGYYTVDRIIVRVRVDGNSSYSGFVYCWYSTDSGGTWTEVTDYSNRVGWRSNYTTQEWRSFSIPSPSLTKLQGLRIKFDIESGYSWDDEGGGSGTQLKISRLDAVVEYTPLATVSFIGSPLSGVNPLSVTFTPTVTDGGNDEYIMWDWGDLGSTNKYEPDADAIGHTYVSTLHSIGAHYSGEITEGTETIYLWAHSTQDDYIETTGPTPTAPLLRYPLGDLDFGSHMVFESGVSETLTIYNDGDGDLTISSIELNVGDVGVFSIHSYSPPIVISATSDSPIVMDFVDTFPGPAGSYSGTFRVNSDDASHPTADFTCTIVLTGADPVFSAKLMRHLKYFQSGAFAGCLLNWRRSE